MFGGCRISDINLSLAAALVFAVIKKENLKIKVLEICQYKVRYWRSVESVIFHRMLTDKYLVINGYDDIAKDTRYYI